MLKRLLLILCLGVFLNLTGATLDSEWRIVLPGKPQPMEVYAAEELQSYLEKVSGIKLEISDKAKENGGNLIIGSIPAVKFDAKDVDQLAVKTIGGNVYLAGRNPRSALYAVYTFLSDVCGIRWLWAGPDGEFVPRKPLIELDGLDIRWTAPFKYRGMHLCSCNGCTETETWMSRNRLNFVRTELPRNRDNDRVKQHREALRVKQRKGFHIVHSTHNITLPASKFQENPELFALRDGKRSMEQLCWTNPQTIEELAKQNIEDCRQFPEIEMLSLFPSDNPNYCQCPECSKYKANELWFKLFMNLTEEIKKECSEMKFASIAYQGYMLAPENVDLSSLEMVEYCQYDRCFVHDIGKCTFNKRSMERIGQWKKKNVPLGIYGYEFDIFIPPEMPMYLFGLIADELRVFRDNGVISVVPEIIPLNNTLHLRKWKNSYPYFRLNYYIYAALLNNPDADYRKLVGEYCNLAYGKAGKSMADYFLKLNDAWGKMDIHLTHYGLQNHGIAGKFLNGKLIDEIRKLLKDAAAKEPDSKNIEIEQKAFEDWVAVYQRDMAAKSAVLVPKRTNNFDGAVFLTSFKSSKDNTYPTTLQMNYDSEAIYVRAVCEDPQISSLHAPSREHDTQLWKTDESLELFFATPDDIKHGRYRHLSVNPAGTRYDAIEFGGDKDVTWNPAWTTTVQVNKNNWTVGIRIPFAELGGVPEKGNVWNFSAARTNGKRKDFESSVYPDPMSWHNWFAFSPLEFIDRTESVPVAIFARPTNYPAGDAMRMAEGLRQTGYQAAGFNDESGFQAAAANAEVVVICHPNAKMPPEFYQQTLLPKLKDGALVIFSSYHGLPLDRYFKMPDLALKWSGWEINPTDRTTKQLRKADWMTTPNDLIPLLEKNQTPASGYYPTKPENWDIWASLEMKNGMICPYLLSRDIGKGLLVVTTCDFIGWGIKNSLFSGDVTQVKMLIENLRRKIVYRNMNQY